MKHEIEQDIWSWIQNYIEEPHKFYDYKFAPCPYARAARLKNKIDVVAYESGNTVEFIRVQVDQLISNDQHSQKIMVFPPSLRWKYHVRWFIKRLNREIVPKGYYIQYGGAKNTVSKYSSILGGEYVLVIINKVSDVIDGHKALLRTSYYDNWSLKHYKNVVLRRQGVIDECMGHFSKQSRR